MWSRSSLKNVSARGLVQKQPFLRLSNGILTKNGVLAPVVFPSDDLTRNYSVNVMSSYYSATQNVQMLADVDFYADPDPLNALPLQLCERFEARPAVLTRPTHFGLRNLAHTTFDYLYPLFATIITLEKVNLVRHIEGDPTLYPLPFVVIFDLSDLAQSGFPANGGRERLLRVVRMIRPLVEDVYFIGPEIDLPYPRTNVDGWCFRDITIGAREQPIRNWDWTYNPNSKAWVGLTPHERDAANALRPWLLEAFRRATRTFFQQECTPEHQQLAVQRPYRDALVMGRSSLRRRLLNADYLAQRLDADYIPDFGALSWCDQYVAVHRRRTLIAMHGAEWSHLLSLDAPRGMVNIELFPPFARKPNMYAAVALMLGASRHALAQVRHLNGSSFDPSYAEHEHCVRMLEQQNAVTTECLFQANLKLQEEEIEQLRTWLSQQIQ
ncbi:hypothetical protein F1559_003694 [Cyanidiococcus yangmingshanensis]|uniref:Uncharacterized protein n=1 Tax=Cyanidiococcus yangmingshanensis TaxID=2690220 RepID=A0A7J7IQ84_9RHOD|nr:hypothetical protein F1559_003694 [Cyanidiococcus yangmingshanensis]